MGYWNRVGHDDGRGGKTCLSIDDRTSSRFYKFTHINCSNKITNFPAVTPGIKRPLNKWGGCLEEPRDHPKFPTDFKIITELIF